MISLSNKKNIFKTEVGESNSFSPTLNDLGFTFIDSIISMFLVGILVIVIHTSNTYITTSCLSNRKSAAYYQTVNNHIQSLYTTDWSLKSNEVITENLKSISVNYTNYQSETIFHTQQITVTFIYENYTNTYVLEKEVDI